MLKFALFSLLIAVALYNWMLFIPEYWYAQGVGDIEDFLQNSGYPLQIHQAQTEDGYILTIHRIPHGRNKPTTGKKDRKPPVFLMHGMLSSSMDWIINGPDKAMALVLADAGYDVWLGNNRGNTYSRRHIILNPDEEKEKFFDYSYQEIGIYDLPAMIDYVLGITGYKKLTYLGFSEGVTSFLVMGSIRPEYNEKILLMNAFAPVTNTYNITSLLFNFLALSPKILGAAEQIGWYEMLSHNTSPFLRLLCNIKPFCRGIFYLLGASEEQLADQEFLNSVLSNSPAGMSLKQITHYIQGTRTGIFGHINYDEEKNLETYDGSNALLYDLRKVTAPIIIYYGENDNLINNEILLNSVAKELPNVVKVYRVPYAHFSHLDFIFGQNIHWLIEETLRNINKYNNISSA